jgi:hypothetical protein
MKNKKKCFLLFFISVYYFINFCAATEKKINFKKLRDPFYPTKNKKAVKKAKQKIRLVGIINNNGVCGAILIKGKKQKIAFKEDNVFGCVVKKVRNDSLVLAKNNKEIALYLN